MNRRRFDLNLTPQVADQLEKLIIDEKAKDEETYHPSRPTCQILEMVVRLGLEFYRVRENRVSEISAMFPKTSETTQKRSRSHVKSVIVMEESEYKRMLCQGRDKIENGKVTEEEAESPLKQIDRPAISDPNEKFRKPKNDPERVA